MHKNNLSKDASKRNELNRLRSESSSFELCESGALSLEQRGTPIITLPDSILSKNRTSLSQKLASKAIAKKPEFQKSYLSAMVLEYCCECSGGKQGSHCLNIVGYDKGKNGPCALYGISTESRVRDWLRRIARECRYRCDNRDGCIAPEFGHCALRPVRFGDGL